MFLLFNLFKVKIKNDQKINFFFKVSIQVFSQSTKHMANANTNMIQTTYSDMMKKETVAPMLGLTKDSPFDIVSENDDGLMMVHYRPDADMKLYANLRGVVVDTKHGNVVSISYPHAHRVVSSSISSVDGKVILGENIVLDADKIRLKIGFEGTLIHVFKHGGKVYRSTRKRLDPSKSRWGNSKTFGDMYWELNGPSDVTLFDPAKEYSSYCHSFIMVHPDVLVSTRDDISKGFMVYLGPKQMYSSLNCPYPLDSVDFELHVPETSSNLEPGIVYAPENLTLEEANKQLIFGFYEGFEGYQYLDSRLLPGEFVIVENLETGQMFRVESPSYAWRSEVRNNDPNLLHRFFELIDFAYLKNNAEDDKKYCSMFPILTLYDKTSLLRTIDSNKIVIWPQNPENPENSVSIPTTRESKLYNIWQCFLVVVPPARQKEVFEYYDILVNRRQELVNWLIETSENSKSVLTDYSKRAQDILTKTKSFAVSNFNKGANLDPKTKEYKTVESMTRENIRNFISKEVGSSLYRLIREMDKMKKVVV